MSSVYSAGESVDVNEMTVACVHLLVAVERLKMLIPRDPSFDNGAALKNVLMEIVQSSMTMHALTSENFPEAGVRCDDLEGMTYEDIEQQDDGLSEAGRAALANYWEEVDL